jgi:thymidylate synthase
MHRYFDSNFAYACALDQCVNHAEYTVSPRGERTREVANAVLRVMSPTEGPIVTRDPDRNAKIARYTQAEFVLHERGERDSEAFAKHAPFWRKIANSDGTVNSAYGWLIWRNKSCPNDTTPWEWARRALQKDPDTRQAFLRFSLPEHQWDGNRDQPCTMHGHFLLRDGALHLTVVMRSNDVVLGLVYDMPWFIHLLHRMAREIGAARVGTYTHIAHSLHLYERDLRVAERMLYGPESCVC